MAKHYLTKNPPLRLPPVRDSDISLTFLKNFSYRPINTQRPIYQPNIHSKQRFHPLHDKNFSKKIFKNIWSIQKTSLTLQCSKRERALSSAGSERLPYKQRVGGSNPSAPTTPKSFSHLKQNRIAQAAQSKSGRLAQLVQSVCLTSRGSGVRIPQRPQIRNRIRHTRRGSIFFFPTNPKIVKNSYIKIQ